MQVFWHAQRHKNPGTHFTHACSLHACVSDFSAAPVPSSLSPVKPTIKECTKIHPTFFKPDIVKTGLHFLAVLGGYTFVSACCEEPREPIIVVSLAPAVLQHTFWAADSEVVHQSERGQFGTPTLKKESASDKHIWLGSKKYQLWGRSHQRNYQIYQQAFNLVDLTSHVIILIYGRKREWLKWKTLPSRYRALKWNSVVFSTLKL